MKKQLLALARREARRYWLWLSASGNSTIETRMHALAEGNLQAVILVLGSEVVEKHLRSRGITPPTIIPTAIAPLD